MALSPSLWPMCLARTRSDASNRDPERGLAATTHTSGLPVRSENTVVAGQFKMASASKYANLPDIVSTIQSRLELTPAWAKH